MVSRPPTPLQRANDSTTEAIAGTQTQPRTSNVGIATIRTRKTRSVPVTWTRRPPRPGDRHRPGLPGPDGGDPDVAGPGLGLGAGDRLGGAVVRPLERRRRPGHHPLDRG